MREGSKGKDVGVEVNEGGEEGCESEEVELGESKVEIRSAYNQQGATRRGERWVMSRV